MDQFSQKYKIQKLRLKQLERALQQDQSDYNVKRQLVEEELIEREADIEKLRAVMRQQVSQLKSKKDIERANLIQHKIRDKKIKLQRTLIQKACSLVRMEEQKINQNSKDQTKLIVKKLFKEHLQSEQIPNKSRKNSLSSILKLIQVLWFKLMADQLSEVISRQLIEKECVISSIRVNYIEKKMVQAQFQKMKMNMKKHQLCQLKNQKQWQAISYISIFRSNEQYFTFFKQVNLQYENGARSRQLRGKLAMLKQQFKALKNIQYIQSQELIKLREHQIQSLVNILSEDFNKLKLDDIEQCRCFVICPMSQQCSQTQEYNIQLCLKQYKNKIKLNRREAISCVQEWANTQIQDIKHQISYQYWSYNEMLEGLAQEERIIGIKRQNLKENKNVH